jgi:short-subunit dehydrogenase
MANKLALVTGASSGIGLSLATDLAKRGFDLVVCSAGDRLPTTTQQLQALQVEVVAVQADLATNEGIESLWEHVIGLGRQLDIACINAGVGVVDCSSTPISTLS